MAVGVVSSQAEVFSVNAVGYVNVPVKPGFEMIANPLNGSPNNDLNNILPLPPEQDGTIIYRFVPGTGAGTGFGNPIQFIDGFGWSSDTGTDPANWHVLAPGEGVFIAPTVAGTLTFVGEVPQGNLVNSVPVNFSIRSSQVPQEANLGNAATDGTLKFPATDGDQLYIYDNVVKHDYLEPYLYIDGFGWSSANVGNDPKGPVIKPGTSFWVFKADSQNWARTFSVNN